MNSRDIDRALVGATLWDDQVRGLHLRVFPTKRVFYLRYRTKAGQIRRPKLGPYPTLSLVKARELARDQLTEVWAGKDPGAPRTVSRTFGALWVDYYATLAQTGTRREFKRLHDSHLTRFDPRPLDSITEQECRQLHASLAATPCEANRALSAMRAAYGWGEDSGYLPRHTSPVHFTAYPEEVRQRYPSAKEAAALVAALEDATPHFRCYVWLLGLTGARPGEWRTARWEYITDQGLVLPKAKRKKHGRIVALSSAARAVLKDVPRLQDCPWIFPGRNPAKAVANVQAPWRDVCKAAGVAGLQMRDMRRWFASLALSSGTSLDHVGQLLGHSQSETTRRYAYLMDEARGRAVEGVAISLGKSGRTASQGRGPARSRKK